MSVDIYLKSQSLWAHLSRFFTVGAMATTTYFLIATLTMSLGLASAQICSVGAYMGGMLVSYAGQSKFTFRIQNHNPWQVLRFALVSIAGLAVSYFAVAIALANQLNPVWGAVTTAISIPVVSFIVMRYWVFSVSDESTTPD